MAIAFPLTTWVCEKCKEEFTKNYASQYILLKAPPASGKSRALMYLALEKLKNNQVKKVNCCCSRKVNSKIFLLQPI